MPPAVARIAATPRDIGIFVAIAVPLGLISGNPEATYEFLRNQSPPALVQNLLLIVFLLSPLIAVAAVRHSGGLTSFMRTRFRWRIDLRWYLISLGLFPVLLVGVVIAYTTVVEPISVDQTVFVLIFLEAVTLGILLNLIENYGWRGFLQEALQQYVSVFVAAICVGVVWWLWHGALLLPGGQFDAIPMYSYTLVIINESIIIAWLYNSTGGSVLHAALMHTSFNASFGVTMFSMIEAGESVEGMYAAAAIVTVVIVAIIVYRADLFRTPRHDSFPSTLF